VIAAFARKTQPSTWQPPSPVQRKLRALVRYKQTLLTTRTQQLICLTGCNDAEVQASLQTVAAILDGQVAELKTKIAVLIEADDQLRTNHQLITSIKDLGSDTTSLILAELYDLGRYASAKAIAADAGITPPNINPAPTSIASLEYRTSVRPPFGILFWSAQAAVHFNPSLLLWLIASGSMARLLVSSQSPPCANYYLSFLVLSRIKRLSISIFPPIPLFHQRNIYQAINVTGAMEYNYQLLLFTYPLNQFDWGQIRASNPTRSKISIR
jgi:hypothetical protein